MTSPPKLTARRLTLRRGLLPTVCRLLVRLLGSTPEMSDPRRRGLFRSRSIRRVEDRTEQGSTRAVGAAPPKPGRNRRSPSLRESWRLTSKRTGGWRVLAQEMKSRAPLRRGQAHLRSRPPPSLLPARMRRTACWREKPARILSAPLHSPPRRRGARIPAHRPRGEARGAPPLHRRGTAAQFRAVGNRPASAKGPARAVPARRACLGVETSLPQRWSPSPARHRRSSKGRRRGACRLWPAWPIRPRTVVASAA